MHRLSIENITEGEIPAILNFSIHDMKDEVWGPIPGYENFYEVSNYGRIKGLNRITEGGHLSWVEQKIKLLTVSIGRDLKGGTKIGSTCVSLYKGNIGCIMSVGKLVYHQFIDSFDLADKGFRINYKDGDHLNLYFKNLVLYRGARHRVKNKVLNVS